MFDRAHQYSPVVSWDDLPNGLGLPEGCPELDSVCTGCDRFVYTPDSGPCTNCFPGLPDWRQAKTQTEANEMEVSDV